MTHHSAVRTVLGTILIPSLLLLGVSTSVASAQPPEKDAAAAAAKKTAKAKEADRTQKADRAKKKSDSPKGDAGKKQDAGKRSRDVQRTRSAKAGPAAERLARMENKLDRLMAEVRRLRREVNQHAQGAVGRSPRHGAPRPGFGPRAAANLGRGPAAAHGWKRPFGAPAYGPPGPPWMAMHGPHAQRWMKWGMQGQRPFGMHRPGPSQRGKPDREWPGRRAGTRQDRPADHAKDSASGPDNRRPKGPRGPMFGDGPQPGPHHGRPAMDRKDRPAPRFPGGREAKGPRSDDDNGPPRHDRSPRSDRRQDRDEKPAEQVD